jgi:hypothetical protein
MTVILTAIVLFLAAFADRIIFAVIVLLTARWATRLALRVKKALGRKTRRFRADLRLRAERFVDAFRFIIGPTVVIPL